MRTQDMRSLVIHYLRNGMISNFDDLLIDTAKMKLFEFIEIWYNRPRRHFVVG